MEKKVNSKIYELIKNFGCAKYALLGAKEVYDVRGNFNGREYTNFVRFWSMVIYGLEKRIE